MSQETKKSKRPPISGRLDAPPGTAVAINDEAVPDNTWSTQDLTAFAVKAFGNARQNERQALSLCRQSVYARVQAGHALTIIRGRHKNDKTWCHYQDKNNLPRTKVWEAISVYEHAVAAGHTPDDVARGCGTWGKAMKTYGVVESREDSADASATSAGDARGSNGQVADSVSNGSVGNTVSHTNKKKTNMSSGSGKSKNTDTREAAESETPQPPITKEELTALQVFVQTVGGWARARWLIMEGF